MQPCLLNADYVKDCTERMSSEINVYLEYYSSFLLFHFSPSVIHLFVMFYNLAFYRLNVENFILVHNKNFVDCIVCMVDFFSFSSIFHIQ